MAKIGYARVSSADQNLDRQLKQLDNVEKIFQESISGASRERPQLIAMLDYIRDDDIVVVTELERLGRNNKELTEVMDEIKSKGATLEVLNLPTLRGIEDANLRRLLNNLI
ncbi:recombinase family protein, partial [Streptococcus agalactiae]|nr:recombinase family protein [Streptococcus agalactiae]